MKKLTFLVALFIMTTTLNVFAEKNSQVDWGEQKEVVIKVNGKDIFFGHGEPTPFIDENGRTQVPIRFVSESLGCKVAWDENERSVEITKEDDNIKLVIGKSVAEKNGRSIYFDTVPFIKSNRTFVPVRFISEAFLDAKVEWNEEIKLVSIYMDDELLISSDFKKIRSVLGDKNVSIDYEVLAYSNKGAPTSAYTSDLYINSEDNDLVMGIRNYDTKSLEAAKLILKFYYPTQYEEAYNKLLETINGEIKKDSTTLGYIGIKNLYYDNRSYGSTKFEQTTCVYIGKVGVKLE